MGLDYGIELYYRREHFANALAALAKQAVGREDTAPLQCQLDGGKRVLIPLRDPPPGFLDLTRDDLTKSLGAAYLRFEGDTFVRHYLLDPPSLGERYVERTGKSTCVVTMGFQLRVECGVRFCALTAKAYSTRESILFEYSPAIHDLFLRLGEKTRALAATLDAEDDGFSPLGRPWLGINATPSRDVCCAEGLGIDEWVEAVLRFYEELNWDWQARWRPR